MADSPYSAVLALKAGKKLKSVLKTKNLPPKLQSVFDKFKAGMPSNGPPLPALKPVAEDAKSMVDSIHRLMLCRRGKSPQIHPVTSCSFARLLRANISWTIRQG